MEKNGPMEKQFAYGKTIRSWKNNLIMEKQFNFGTKFDFEKKNRFCNQIYILNFGNFFNFENFFAYFVNFVASQILNPQLSSVIIFSFLENSDMDKNLPLEKNSPMEKQFRSWIKFQFCKLISIL